MGHNGGVSGSGRAGCILVVEDQGIVRNLLARVLRTRDYAVVLAADGHEALELVSRHAFDLVILDRRMPEMGGEVLSRALRAQVPGLPLLCMSGDVPDDWCGPDGPMLRYLRKPFHVTALLDAVAVLLGAAHATPEEGRDLHGRRA